MQIVNEKAKTKAKRMEKKDLLCGGDDDRVLVRLQNLAQVIDDGILEGGDGLVRQDDFAR